MSESSFQMLLELQKDWCLDNFPEEHFPVLYHPISKEHFLISNLSLSCPSFMLVMRDKRSAPPTLLSLLRKL